MVENLFASSGQASRVESGVTVHLLGTSQDAGYPHVGCLRPCCESARRNPSLRRRAVSMAVVDSEQGRRWLFDATPDFPSQLESLDQVLPQRRPLFSGIFLTHAHLGHYTGLLHLGREAMGTRSVPVFALPRMRNFLETNGPWSQLVDLENIELHDLKPERPVLIGSKLAVTPLLIPHRGEFSETAGFRIAGPNRSVLFLPDIDRWEDWEEDLEEVLLEVDVAYLDATFFDERELPGGRRAEIPHPSICDTMERLAGAPASEKAKVRFVHFNHSNPVLNPDSREREIVLQSGFGIAEEGEIFSI